VPEFGELKGRYKTWELLESNRSEVGGWNTNGPATHDQDVEVTDWLLCASHVEFSAKLRYLSVELKGLRWEVID
jgi:hypothetical protein